MANNIDIAIRGFDKSKGAFASVTKNAKKTQTSLQKFNSGANKALVGIGKFAKVAAAGIIAVGAGLLMAAKRTAEFNKQIGQIATLADVSIGKTKREVMDLSAEFGLAKDELTKGLYDALSAGVPKDNAFEFLRVAAQAAVAGAATTAESVDFLTSALNAFNKPASEAAKVSDVLFTTIKQGKTTMSELAQSFSTVAPLAAASGVAFEDIMAATASLTKQGTPTAQAMTQIRAAIIGMNKTLGDGYLRTHTLQEGFEEMARRADGSSTKLKSMVGRVEGVMAILGTTGAKSKAAMLDIEAVGKSAGSTAEAFSKMKAAMVLDKATQALDNLKISIGSAALDVFGEDIDTLTQYLIELEKSGAFQRWGEDMKTTIEGVMAAMKPLVTVLKLAGQGVKILATAAGGAAGEQDAINAAGRALNDDPNMRFKQVPGKFGFQNPLTTEGTWLNRLLTAGDEIQKQSAEQAAGVGVISPEGKTAAVDAFKNADGSLKTGAELIKATDATNISLKETNDILTETQDALIDLLVLQK